MQSLVRLMLQDGTIPNDRYHACLRPWNIFNECDLDKSGTLDEKEMEILLWIQLRQRPTHTFVREFAQTFDEDGSGDISRSEWVKAIMLSAKGGIDDDKSSDPGSEGDMPLYTLRRMSGGRDT